MTAFSPHGHIRRFFVSVTFFLLAATGVHAQTVVEIWQGKIQTDSGPRVVFRLEHTGDGPLHGALYQPDQSGEGVVLSSVVLAKGEFSATQAAMDLSYRGRISADGKVIDGTLTREGKTYALRLDRATPETEWKHEGDANLAPMASSAEMAFDVATIRPSRPDTPRSIRTRTHTFSTTGTTLENLIGFAWGLRAPRIDGEPDWAKTEKLDITAKPNMEGQPSEEQDREMLKKLLAERFGLKVHTVQREFPVLALTLEQNHVQMVASDPEFWHGSIYVKDTPGGDTQVQFVGQSMAMFADTLMNFIRERMIVDETGLDGHFNFALSVNTADLKSSAEDVRGDAVRRAAKDGGFKLTQKRVSLSVLMIDAVEKASEN